MKKGFTLIELLAVIVILAIIMLIATPIVLTVINDAKESAIFRSAEFYIDAAEHSIATSTLKEVQIEDRVYSIMQDGNVCIGTLEDNICEGEILKVEMDGEVPNDGRITVVNGKITNVILTLNNKVIKKNNQGKFIVIKPLINYIKNLYSETKTSTLNGVEYSLDQAHSLMNDRLGSKDIAKTDGNIRYYGSNPNNYIDIGDRDANGNIIFWRIIGLFKDIEVTDEEGKVIRTENLVKIIRADYITSGEVKAFSWDYISTGEYDNNWHDSTLQLMLNDEETGYYGSGTINYYNYRQNYSPEPTQLNFESTGLSRAAHSKIERVNWDLGGHTSNNVYVDAMYKYERAGTNKWSGKIALMNLSDYGYGTDLSSCQSTLGNYNSSTCTNSNWLLDSTKGQWPLNPYSSMTSHVFSIYSNGTVYVNGTNYASYGVRPVLYLKSDVGIIEEGKTSEGLKYLVVE